MSYKLDKFLLLINLANFNSSFVTRECKFNFKIINILWKSSVLCIKSTNLMRQKLYALIHQ